MGFSINALSDSDMAVRGYAIQALARRGGPQAMSYLRDALRDPDPSVRLMVVEDVIGAPDGLPLLQEASSDSEESVRSSALRGLKEALAEQQ
jgi:HEAT repeat protein